jgi:hypothetical protein
LQYDPGICGASLALCPSVGLVTTLSLYAKKCIRPKKIISFQKGYPRLDSEKLYAQQQEEQVALQGKPDAVECESGNAEVP